MIDTHLTWGNIRVLQRPFFCHSPLCQKLRNAEDKHNLIKKNFLENIRK